MAILDQNETLRLEAVVSGETASPSILFELASPTGRTRGAHKFKNRATNKLIIGWLYPELMSTYGDRGNIICLIKRCEWRDISVQIKNLDFDSTQKNYESCDLIFGGGAQDRQQAIVIKDLLSKKSILRKIFENDIPGLFVCGSPQLLGHYYETADKKRLPGLEVFDMYTESGFGKPRLIGNLIADTQWGKIVGFENHSGRTYLDSVKPLGKVLSGFGNNGEDGTEGAIHRNVIATYSHGPFLPKNPHVADWLIKTALEVKYYKKVELKLLDDSLEWQAHNFILRKLGI